ncbi:MAG: ankyrin repeat domain-containing protein, partial [Chlamydiae bacterium]|nr:ankyrin repeat domain-containing protein [Chlamydiota bacterium]
MLKFLRHFTNLTMTQAISTIPITLESLQKRQENALKVERALLLVREGKKVENLSLYLNEILKLHQAAQETQKVLQDSKKRIPRGFKEKFVEHEKALQRIKDIVQPILQAAVRRPPLPLPKNPPWEGKLHKGETPLHWAVRHHDRDLALRLTLHGHPVTIPDDLGVTPLDEAALQKDEVMKYVLLHPDLVLDKEKEAQYSRGQQEIKQQLKDLKRVNFASLSPVCQAAIRGDLETLEQSQDLDSPDPKTGLRPLHYAILAGQTPVIKFLIENDTNPYALTPKRHSYLDYAIIAGNAGLYEEYLKLGLPFRLAKEEK